jgi:hypothetical protein
MPAHNDVVDGDDEGAEETWNATAPCEQSSSRKIDAT